MDFNTDDLETKIKQSGLVNNKFWDGSDPNGDGTGKKENLGSTFYMLFSEWAVPYLTKGTKVLHCGLGLFGLAVGHKIALRGGGVRKIYNAQGIYSLAGLLDKFAKEFSIPLYVEGDHIEGLDIFSNEYSYLDHKFTYCYWIKLDYAKKERARAHKAVYGF